MTGVRISGLGKAYGALRVLDDLDLDVPAGSTTAVLGSSGCGKSTLLRIVAGFVRPDAGTVHVGERLVAGPGTQVAAQHRGVGYVPQEGALFPHLTVAGNVLFGLGRRERSTQRRDELLDLAELPTDLADRYPHELSGGQQQRVALARALAPRPAVVLLDEPFSSLDTALRASAGRTVTRVLRNAGATAVLVTHDQGEALSLADQVAVMRGGRFVQVAPPSVVYGRPADAETALSVGGATLLAGEVAGPVATTELGELALLEVPKPGPAQVLLRPEQVEVTWDGDPRHPAATVREVDYHGAQVVVRLELASGAALTAHCPGTLPPEPGDVVGVRIVGPVIAYPDGDPA